MLLCTTNFSNISGSNFKTKLISQSNVMLAYIKNIHHTSEVSICLDMIFPKIILEFLHGSLCYFFLEWDDSSTTGNYCNSNLCSTTKDSKANTKQ